MLMAWQSIAFVGVVNIQLSAIANYLVRYLY